MNIYSLTGQCTRFLNSKLKEIGFKNIESIDSTNDNFLTLISKPDFITNKKYKYKIQITFEGEI